MTTPTFPSNDLNEHRLFLDAISANPNDDTIRLAFADWLDRNGGAIGEARARVERLRVLRRAICENPRDDAPRRAWADLAYVDAGDASYERIVALRASCRHSSCRQDGYDLCLACREIRILTDARPSSNVQPGYSLFVRRQLAMAADGVAVDTWCTRYIQDRGFGLCNGLLGPEYVLFDGCKNGSSVTARYHRDSALTSLFVFHFHRGFIANVTCNAKTWRTFGHRIVGRSTEFVGTEHPVQGVRLTDLPQYTFDRTSGAARFEGQHRGYIIPRHEDFDHSQKGIIRYLLSCEWPDIDFILPGADEESVP